MDKQEQKLKKLLALMDETPVTEEEFLRAFDLVLSVVGEMKKNNEAVIGEMKTLFQDTLKKIQEKDYLDIQEVRREFREEFDELLTKQVSAGDKLSETLVGKVEKTIEKLEKRGEEMFQEQKNTLNFVRDKVRGIRDGQDADEETIVNKVLSQITLPTVDEYNDAPIREDIKDVRDTLQESIKNMNERLQEISRRKLGGGGTSDSGVAYSMLRIVQTETPSGDIDGVNKVYTLTNSPKVVMGFWINGQFIHDSEYTLSGNTITFTTALPASLSGKGFTIKYV